MTKHKTNQKKKELRVQGKKYAWLNMRQKNGICNFYPRNTYKVFCFCIYIWDLTVRDRQLAKKKEKPDNCDELKCFWT